MYPMMQYCYKHDEWVNTDSSLETLLKHDETSADCSSGIVDLPEVHKSPISC